VTARYAEKMTRRAPAALALALLLGACAQQAPDRNPLPPTPGELTFPTTSTTVATASGALTDSEGAGGCRVTTASGADVLGTTEGFDVADILVPGDQITAVDDVSIANAQGLVDVITGRSPGEVVSLRYVHDGTEQSASVALGQGAEDPEQGRLGVEIGNAFRDFSIEELPELPLGPNPLLAELGESIYFLDPSIPTWRRSPAPAVGSTIVLLDGEAFARRFATAELVSLRSGEAILLPLEGKGLIQIIGVSAGNLVVSAATLNDDQFENPEVISIEIATMTVTWHTALPDFEGSEAEPRVGWVSPDGAYVAVTSSAGDARLHTLLDRNGEIIAGWGADDTPFVRSDGVLGGWLDADRLGYVFSGESSLSIGIRDLNSAESDTILPLPGIIAVAQLAVVPTTDTAVLSTPTGSSLIDLTTGTPIHPLSTGCGPLVVSATGG